MIERGREAEERRRKMSFFVFGFSPLRFLSFARRCLLFAFCSLFFALRPSPFALFFLFFAFCPSPASRRPSLFAFCPIAFVTVPSLQCPPLFLFAPRPLPSTIAFESLLGHACAWRRRRVMHSISTHSAVGNWTQVCCVTGRNTNHYTTADLITMRHHRSRYCSLWGLST